MANETSRVTSLGAPNFPNQPPTSSSDSSSISISTDCEVIRIVMKEISEYLQSVEPLHTITEAVLQRIATIVVSHLNNSMNESLLLTNLRRIDREELMVKLRSLTGKRSKFLRRVEQYLHERFVDDGGPQCLGEPVERDDENQEVLQVKKQNNTVATTRNSVIVQQGENDEAPDEGAAGVARGMDPDLLQMENNSNDEPGLDGDHEERADGESTSQVDQLWATDEEVEILSTHDGSAN